MIGHRWAKAWSKSQNLVALSSAEFGTYVSVKASVEAIGLQPIGKDLDIDLELRILADASAALGITARRGIGKVRRLDGNHISIGRQSHLDPRVARQEEIGIP